MWRSENSSENWRSPNPPQSGQRGYQHKGMWRSENSHENWRSSNSPHKDYQHYSNERNRSPVFSHIPVHGLFTRQNQGKDPSKCKGQGRNGSLTRIHSEERGTISLDCLNHPRSRDGRSLRGTHQPREKERPLGFKELERLLTLPCDAVVLKLLEKQSGYPLLLNEAGIKDDKLFLLVHVLSRATNTKSSKESLYELLNITCQQSFMDKLCSFALTVRRKHSDKSVDFFTNLQIFLETYINAMTNTAIDRVPSLIDACIEVLLQLKDENTVSEDLLKKYENLQEILTEASKRWEEVPVSQGMKKRQFEKDDMKPPENFRELSVLPTVQDLTAIERPFLRKNIIQGKYRDEEHYLDVQFRLLREDFVKPLRNGISDFRSNVNSRIRDIRIYRNVSVVGASFKNQKMLHAVQLNVPKHVKLIENSKRLLFGNLLCFSNDNFKSLIFASVSERDPELLKRSIILVHFESDIENVDFTGGYIMVESKAYFMAYKHVLMALQEMDINGVPMVDYVIHVNPDVEAPTYLSVEHSYDLRVINGNFKKRLSLLYRFLSRQRVNPNDDDPLKTVFVRKELPEWPTEDALGLDASQRRALRNALTHELAIIQGPPGTGKTFIGLKITEILLHNNKFWKDQNNPTPILVVCYTNHALDQFLEGITSFTDDIVRVGSRTKSEIIEEFQINKLIRSRYGRGRYRDPFGNNALLHNEMEGLELEIERLRDVLEACRNPRGLISLNIFKREGIIPAHLLQQLFQGLAHWLLSVPPEELDSLKRKNQSVKQKIHQDNRFDINEQEEGNVSDDNYGDLEELLVQEERERLIGDGNSDDEVDVKKATLKDDNNVSGVESVKTFIYFGKLYEVTEKMLHEEMTVAEYEWHKDGGNLCAYFYYTFLSSQRNALKIGLGISANPTAIGKLLKGKDVILLEFDFLKRWQLYKYWCDELLAKISDHLRKTEAKCQRVSRALEEIKNQDYLYAMRRAAVVGMTTTGAAQYNSILQDLSPAIVIIEEAAEILESHVVTSVTAKCQHLIMIGDHQQLRPSTTVYELSTKYGLDTSLFERMIKNGLPYETLQYQHRMRPGISKLLVPSIYAELKDHPSVDEYPDVMGITKNVFFINHEIPERQISDDNNSHENQHEAELLMGLCRHLMLQGYKPEEVTILTPYSGQFFLLRKLQQEHRVCQNVRICVVDNFQGEENNIILLSLVRSNVEGNVGFLRTDNRVCVALSRAKHGLYITGNMDMLSASSNLWKKIRSDLIADGNMGSSLTLRCEIHPEQLTSITKGNDFFKSPAGGCLQICNKSLPRCAHKCTKLCHMYDRDHMEYECLVPCPKSLCSLDHPCPKRCHEICPPCTVRVEKTLICGHKDTIPCHVSPKSYICVIQVDKTFPCGHSKYVPCHVSPDDFLCQVQVEKELDHCQHVVTMPCHRDTKTFLCYKDCDTRLDCGHKCRLKCHRTDDPNHEEYNCTQCCTKLNTGCTQNHPCQKKCYEECGVCIVKVNKMLPCGHEAKNVECNTPPEEVKCKKACKTILPCEHPCRRLCYEKCGNCAVIVTKTIPDCSHDIKIECGLPPTTKKCSGKCPKMLPCGHPCLKRCNDVCTKQCKVIVSSINRCPKNHIIKMSCHMANTVTGEDAWSYCDEPCKEKLSCDHPCVGNCGRCYQGRLHVSCSKPCNKALVCGHICKYPCSTDCPPCQENCLRKCEHSRCHQKCGVLCHPCMEKCKRQCKHQQCKMRCGQKCSIKSCQLPCPKELKCGHKCIGFCGDPCPPLCRICNREELTEFVLLGFEEDEDSRFVLLEDCRHTIEVQGLEGWLAQDSNVIGMKSCPRCRHPIYNNRRYQEMILDTYMDVHKIKFKYYRQQVKIETITHFLNDREVRNWFSSEVAELLKALGKDPSKSKKKSKPKMFNGGELKLHLHQAQVLNKATDILESNCEYTNAKVYRPPHSFHLNTPAPRQQVKSKHLVRLEPLIKELVKRVMEKTVILAPQLEKEVSSELQRLAVLPSYWTFLENVSSKPNLNEIKGKLEMLMDPTIRYDDELDVKVRALLKESEQHIGALGITEGEKVMILKATGLRQGHWYKCPKGHRYCITECGGATVESNCPNCGSRIGRTSHRLHSDNAVAQEMDGAEHPAWEVLFSVFHL